MSHHELSPEQQEIRALARRYARGSEPYDDLVQAGCLGLISAVDRWDAARGPSFEAYAVPTIHGAIRHHLRDRAPGGRAPRTGEPPVLTPLEDDLPGREDPIAAADDRLALTEADLTSLVSAPLEFTGAATEQVRRVVARVDELVTAHPDAAAYAPRAIL